jgi:hypothetical protein
MAWHWPGQLTAAGAKTLCAALRDCKTLLVLDLGTNSIGDAGPLGRISSHLISSHLISSIHLISFHPSIHPSIHPPIHPSTHPPIHSTHQQRPPAALMGVASRAAQWLSRSRGDSGAWRALACGLLHICAFVLLHFLCFCVFVLVCSRVRLCPCSWVGRRQSRGSVSKLGWLAYAAPARRRAFCSQAHTHECVALRELLR